MKKMHETMLNAVREESQKSDRSNRDGEIWEMQAKHQKQVKELQQKLKESEFKANNMAINMEEQEIASERRIQDLMLDKRNLDNKIKKL